MKQSYDDLNLDAIQGIHIWKEIRVLCMGCFSILYTLSIHHDASIAICIRTSQLQQSGIKSISFPDNQMYLTIMKFIINSSCRKSYPWMKDSSEIALTSRLLKQSANHSFSCVCNICSTTCYGTSSTERKCNVQYFRMHVRRHMSLTLVEF